jgi:hypothetical protein
LQSLETGLDASGHCFHCERFGQTGNPLEQEMTIREEAEQQSIHQIFLAYHNVTDLLAESRNPLAQLPNFLCNFLRRFHTVWSDTHPRENVRSNVPQLADFLLISLANPLLPTGPRRASAEPE